jgi:hypothetical protein
MNREEMPRRRHPRAVRIGRPSVLRLGAAVCSQARNRTNHEQGDRQAVDDQHRHRCHPR